VRSVARHRHSVTPSCADERHSYVVGKIATNDFPEHWPDLLPTVLGAIPTGSDNQLHGALRVLGDIIDESLSEEQFFTMARDIVQVVTDVALNDGRKASLRALAIHVFRGCFDLMDIVKEDHMKEVKGFAEEVLSRWNPFFVEVLHQRLPEVAQHPTSQPDSWNEPIALKLQVVKTLLKIKAVFPNLLLPQSWVLFQGVWNELSVLQAAHQDLYIDTDAQGRLEDSDNLPYTLDFLVLEELDFLNQCFRAPPVQQQLEASGPQWMVELMTIVVSFSRITREEEDLWDIDCSLYLAEETSVTANYTARTASGDLMIKLGEWFNQRAIDGLFEYTKELFIGEGISWRHQEAALYLFNMLLSDFQDMDKTIPLEISQSYLQLVDYAINRPNEPLLRARGYLVGGTLARSFETPDNLLERTVQCINNEESEVVQVACIKAVEGFIRSNRASPTQQMPILTAISRFMQSKDQGDMEEADELLVTLAETLRAVINMDPRITLVPDVQSLDMLFTVAKLGASNFQATMIVCEAFEEIVKTLHEPENYTTLCSRSIPTLTSAFNVSNVTENEPLITVSTIHTMVEGRIVES
jgi:importin-9